MALDVEVSGSTGPLIVAVHGIQGTRGAWAPVVTGVDGLARDHRWVLPNLRGRAAAMRGTGVADYRLDAFAAELGDVVREHVGDQPYVMAGWSLGVSITLQYLLRAEAPQPAGVVLVSGTPWLAGAAWFRGEGEALLASIAERRQRLGLQQHADDQAVAWTWQAIRDVDQRPLLARLAIPALVIHGRDDGDCPYAHGQMLAEGLRAPMQALDGVGHSVLAQAGATVASHLRTFVRDTLTPRKEP